MTEEKDIYIKTLEQTVEKYEKELSKSKDITINLVKNGSVIQIITAKDGTEEVHYHLYSDNIDRYDIRNIFDSLGYNTIITAESDDNKKSISLIKISLFKFQQKFPKVYKSLKIFIIPWESAETYYDIVIAPIANIITASIILIPFIILGWVLL
jgi:hypothetical protein